jgi:hypothetical protein
MKKPIGWVLFALLLPVIFMGAVAYLIADASVYGWRIMSDWLEATLAQKTEGGMTLRDYFAAKAMQGIFAANAEHEHDDADIFDAVAEAAYKQADAMLKARGQQ